ncbi:hypothetical protein ZIOFF_035643 [Zingiber officinale]|uniref:Uncharacterized protein n=1 Tax=Zingiber officinale TaxID=94328 RepID=A0A8J5GHG4_ZINOF|nr:hypothetical protein ZIOFF_035643 [Zingiber officinale]
MVLVLQMQVDVSILQLLDVHNYCGKSAYEDVDETQDDKIDEEEFKEEQNSVACLIHMLYNDDLEEMLKVVDLLVPYQRGGKIGLFDGAGVGKKGFIMELMINNIGKG